jgi:hypothetical protein
MINEYMSCDNEACSERVILKPPQIGNALMMAEWLRLNFSNIRPLDFCCRECLEIYVDLERNRKKQVEGTLYCEVCGVPAMWDCELQNSRSVYRCTEHIDFGNVTGKKRRFKT